MSDDVYECPEHRWRALGRGVDDGAYPAWGRAKWYARDHTRLYEYFVLCKYGGVYAAKT